MMLRRIWRLKILYVSMRFSAPSINLINKI
jgi:hypothetical protein